MHLGTVAKGKQMFELYENYCQTGGNFFDTAHSYACWMPDGDGASERALGECLKYYGNRSEVIISTKGGRPRQGPIYPRPDDCMTDVVIGADITESLNRLQIDTIDLYTLHCDDTRHSVGEIIEMLNAEITRGRVRYIGASNWSIDRIVAANAYAASKNLQGFVVSSPQWNLAHPNRAPAGWDGNDDKLAHMMTRADIDWHRENNFATMPWTPSAYGYLAGSTSVNAQSFDNPISRERRVRARELAKELGTTPNQIALAYLLAHEFPVFPILGTMNMEHLTDALAADGISLTPQQRDWLYGE